MSILGRDFAAALAENGVDFFSGVPDSLLAPFCAAVSNSSLTWIHCAAANEGSAVALAAGHHLATGRLGCVYMQNSGLGNAINPLVSLADALVYGIPLVMIIGWRAEVEGTTQRSDEPQHRRQGLVTLPLLNELAIPYVVLGVEADHGLDAVTPIIDRAKRERRPVAIVVRKDVLTGPIPGDLAHEETDLTRENAIAIIAAAVDARTPIVATTGKISRELYEFRQRSGTDGELDFLTVGSMGHASQIATGIAMAQPARKIVCLDGDGAALMHLGGLTVSSTCANLRHVVLNNRVHDSVGGQPTCAPDIRFSDIAGACGYRWAKRATSALELRSVLSDFLEAPASALLEVMVLPGSRADLGRPKRTPQEARVSFMTRIGAAI